MFSRSEYNQHNKEKIIANIITLALIAVALAPFAYLARWIQLHRKIYAMSSDNCTSYDYFDSLAEYRRQCYTNILFLAWLAIIPVVIGWDKYINALNSGTDMVLWLALFLCSIGISQSAVYFITGFFINNSRIESEYSEKQEKFTPGGHAMVWGIICCFLVMIVPLSAISRLNEQQALLNSEIQQYTTSITAGKKELATLIDNRYTHYKAPEQSIEQLQLARTYNELYQIVTYAQTPLEDSLRNEKERLMKRNTKLNAVIIQEQDRQKRLEVEAYFKSLQR